MPNLPVPIGGPDAFAIALDSARGYARAEHADRTRDAYRRDLIAFRDWCVEHGLEPLPAEPATVAAYLAHSADAGLKVSTIERRAAAISYAHRVAGCGSPTRAEPVKAVLKGIRRRIGVAVERKAPATARAISAMLKRIPDTLIGRRDRALLLIGFAAALRRSELVALDLGDIERAPEGIIVHVRRSKTDQEGAGQTIAVPRGTKLRPVEALDAWLAAARLQEGALFRSVAKGGRLGRERLSDRAVALIVKRRAAAANLDPSVFAGHSLRAGFVTSALETGADVLKTMDQTRHRRVETLRGYDRRAKLFKAHAGKGFL